MIVLFFLSLSLVIGKVLVMKKYIFLTSSIGRIGGAQMFISNKYEYLKRRGWHVDVFFFNEYDVIRIENLKVFSQNYLPELRYPVQSYTNKQIEHVLSIICQKTGNAADETVVETQLISLAFWGELVAQRLNGIHILNYLEESIPRFSENEIAFFDFKVRRRECLNASKKSLSRLFKEHYVDDYDQYQFILKTPCSNVVSDVADNNIKIAPADYTITSIGRLDKPYVRPMVDDILNVVRSHTDKSFNLIFIGGSPNGKSEVEIENAFKGVDNVNLYLLGYLFPIPKQLLGYVSASIATSNSVLVTANLSIPTIAVDANDFQAIGVYGYDTVNTVFRKEEAKRKISDVLAEILFTEKYAAKKADMQAGQEMDQTFSEQEKFIESTSKDKQYFDVLSIYSMQERYRMIMKRMAHSVLDPVLCFLKK